jgi:hypothetical protein
MGKKKLEVPSFAYETIDGHDCIHKITIEESNSYGESHYILCADCVIC